MRLLKNILLHTPMLNVENKEDNLFQILFWNSLCIAFFLLPFGTNIPTPFFILAIVFGFGNILRARNFRISENKILLFLPLYFTIMVFSLVYTDNISVGVKLLERSLSFLFFPIIFLYTKENSLMIKRLLIFLLIGLLVSFLVNLVIASYNSISIIDGVLSIDTSINGGYSFLDSFSHGGSYFISGEFSKLLHPSYVSVYILVVLVYFIKNKFKNWLQILVTIFLLAYLFLLASRSAFMILVVISIFLIFYTKDVRKKYIMVGCFLVGLLFLSSNPRISHFYSRLKGLSSMEHYKYATSEQARLLTWDASIKLIKSEPIFGYGVGDANDVLIDKFKDLDYIYNYKKQYNAHNQFLQTLLQTGIIGFIFLLVPFVFLAIGLRKNYGFLILLILFFSLMFESMLIRFNGIVFYAIMLSLLFKKNLFNNKIL
ncbi:O-antigen ligase family protein [Maribacter sp. Asnod1-A12]|uniref:O-antigen ligase family protein n=1 Tax=Maribacter sp. Asnod1-A12 TaxID=3160576 RepID=UPI003865C862